MDATVKPTIESALTQFVADAKFWREALGYRRNDFEVTGESADGLLKISAAVDGELTHKVTLTDPGISQKMIEAIVASFRGAIGAFRGESHRRSA